MKKKGILHAELMKEITSLAHMEKFMIGDAGMPIPDGIKVIDLAFCEGSVDFETVLEAIVNEVQIEHYYIASETIERNKVKHRFITEQLENCDFDTMSHSELKQFSSNCKFAIRTGEFSPFANVIVQSGVIF